MAELLKNVFDRKFIKSLAAVLKDSYPKFDKTLFIKGVFTKDWTEKALKHSVSVVVNGIVLSSKRFIINNK